MRRVVFTALIGGYERLIEKPVTDEPGLSYVCFTDSPSLTMPGWETVLVNPLFPLDPVRSARALKIRGHDCLSEFDEWLWLDNRIELLVSPMAIFDLLLPGDVQFGAPLHSFRTTVRDEFDAILRHGYDDPRRVREQFRHYISVSALSLDEHPIWTAIIARKNSTEISAFNSLWADHVMRYSRRDQLSIRYALASHSFDCFLPVIDNVGSPYHRWVGEEEMGRRRDASRWRGGGTRGSRSYTMRDQIADGAFKGMRYLTSARSLVRRSFKRALSE